MSSEIRLIGPPFYSGCRKCLCTSLRAVLNSSSDAAHSSQRAWLSKSYCHRGKARANVYDNLLNLTVTPLESTTTSLNWNKPFPLVLTSAITLCFRDLRYLRCLPPTSAVAQHSPTAHCESARHRHNRYLAPRLTTMFDALIHLPNPRVVP